MIDRLKPNDTLFNIRLKPYDLIDRLKPNDTLFNIGLKAKCVIYIKPNIYIFNDGL